ncbi:hypothetical protein VTN31DRAFT_5212 [Thermomyces dupontii]|uniref:uncharacterized protein n=1 Tax=Talaromyces thermophilus TaxID=28565 RepID=UPI003741F5C9
MAQIAQSSSGTSSLWRYAATALLTVQYTAVVMLLHYSRVMPTVGGKRYVPSTAVFLAEVIKLAISMTAALHELMRRVPSSMPATSLLFSLFSSVFSGDSWKMALPAILYTLANSLQYIALSNLDAATFQLTYQVKLLFVTVFGLLLLQRNVPIRNWALLLFLAAGVALVQLPAQAPDPIVARRNRVLTNFPGSVREWKKFREAAAARMIKRSATYEGIEEDLLLEHPALNSSLGLLATLCASAASAAAATLFERVVRDNTTQTSLWVRNVQLAIYSAFPAFFIGIVFFDGQIITKQGFFAGYNWVVWLLVVIQAVGGVGAAFSIKHADIVEKNSAAAASILLSTVGSLLLFDLELSANFAIGAAVVVAAIFLFESPPSYFGGTRPRPPPIRIETYDKDENDAKASPQSPPNDFSIKLPTTPLLSADSQGLSTSRPQSPVQPSRAGASRNAE